MAHDTDEDTRLPATEVAQGGDCVVVGDLVTSSTINELATAMAKAQGAMGPAIKGSRNPHFRSTYADLAAGRAAYQEALSANGLALIQSPSVRVGRGGETRVRVQTMVMHTSGQWVTGVLEMQPTKADPQGIGSAITYARRYGALAFTGIAPDDDDGNAASAPREAEGEYHRREYEKPPTPKPPRQKPPAKKPAPVKQPPARNGAKLSPYEMARKAMREARNIEDLTHAAQMAKAAKLDPKGGEREELAALYQERIGELNATAALARDIAANDAERAQSQGRAVASNREGARPPAVVLVGDGE